MNGAAADGVRFALDPLFGMVLAWTGFGYSSSVMGTSEFVGSFEPLVSSSVGLHITCGLNRLSTGVCYKDKRKEASTTAHDHEDREQAAVSHEGTAQPSPHAHPAKAKHHSTPHSSTQNRAHMPNMQLD